MKVPNKVIEAGAWSLEHGHQLLLKLSGGRFPKRVMGMEPIELHHIGRKSGLERTTLLTAPVFAPDQIVVVASKGGHEDNPDWYKNLVVTPNVGITAQGIRREMVARTATPEEKDELWPQIVSAYSGYAGYQRNTRRDIPVVICTPAT